MTEISKIIDPALFLNQELISPFICPLCKGIIIEPALCDECMNIFCGKCIRDYLKSHDNICLSGKKVEQEPKYFPIFQQHLNLFDMKCKNFVNGCNWSGKFGKYKDHINECPKEPLICGYEGCKQMILRENFDRHINECQFKPINCINCGINLKKDEVEKHDLICLKKVINCPQNCGEKFERSKLNEHLKICRMNIIDCRFKEVGCTEKFDRNNLDKMNQNIEHHLNLLLEDYKKFKDKIIKNLGVNLNEFNQIENLNLFNKNDIKKIKIEGIKDQNFINNKNKEAIPDNEQIEKKSFSITRQKVEQSCKNKENDSFEKNKAKEENLKIEINTPSLDSEDIGLPIFKKEPRILLGKKRENENNKGIKIQNINDINPSCSKEEKNKDVNPFWSKEEKNKDTYCIKDLPEGFEIQGNKVLTKSLDGNKHFFVFANDNKKVKADQIGDFVVKFIILEENKWLALGFCDKKVVEDNKFNFAEKKGSNGCFIISTNSMIWHCQDKKQRKKITDVKGLPNLQSKNITFECIYSPFKCLIEFYVNNKFIASLSNVKPIKSEYLTPCLVFLKNCEVQTIYEYPK